MVKASVLLIGLYEQVFVDYRKMTTDRRDTAMIPHGSAFDARRSQRLDWAILMTESTHGWRRAYWWLEWGI
jgi:hypothetical protein